MVHAALNGSLADVHTKADRFFVLNLPVSVPDASLELLRLREQWPDRTAQNQKAEELPELFRKNFEPFASEVAEEVRAGEPHVR